MDRESSADDVHAKALAINLDPTIYGTIAEIGAGQEVARWFLRVGAASGTVAQTVSAYDKTVSDERYGASGQYVSRERLVAMLDREYELLQRRLGPARGADTRFFVFADTVAARNYRGDNQQHGWLGVRFQAKPGADPSDALLHVNLMDPTAQLQQEALGVLGVNLVHAAFLHRHEAEAFLEDLFSELSVTRIEVDVLELRGPGLSHAIVFDGSGTVAEPSGVLRKRPLVVERGRFGRVAPFHADMLRRSEARLRAEGVPLRRDPAPVLEMTIHHAAGRWADAELADDAEVLRRVGELTSLGPVMVSDFAQTYQLVEYLRRHTAEPVRLVVGVSAIAQLMQHHFYESLPGALLEGLGRLLATNVKVHAYPMPVEAFRAALAGSPEDRVEVEPSAGLVRAADLRPRAPLHHLYRYLLDAGWVESLPAGDTA